jgi:hypothetical protein
MNLVRSIRLGASPSREGSFDSAPSGTRETSNSTCAAAAVPYPQDSSDSVITAKKPPQARAPHAGWMTVQAGLLTCGSSPFSAFPGKEKPSGIVEKNSPPTVAGAAADLAQRLPGLTTFPFSPAERPANLNVAIIETLAELSICLDAPGGRPASGKHDAYEHDEPAAIKTGAGDLEGLQIRADTK